MCACLSSSQQARKWFAVRGSYTQCLESILEVLLCRGTGNLKLHFGGGESSLMLENRGFELELDRGLVADVHSLV
jgi:hypothetical protein